MKLSSILSTKAVAALAIAAFSIAGLSAQTSERTVTVIAVKGDAKYAHGNGGFAPLSRGVKLAKGDVVKTGPNSHADLGMGANVGIVRVAPQSTLSLDNVTVTKTGADAVTETMLTVTSGSIYAKVNKLAKGSRYEITSPKGIAGIRGTSLAYGANGQLTVAEGTAASAYPKPGGVDTFIVKTGETVGPTDRPSHPAGETELRDISSNLTDAGVNYTEPAMTPYAAPLEPFISPTLPGN